ncbi:MAG: hypothetical protein ACR2H3_08410 [Acidimicrobiales bacterium]
MLMILLVLALVGAACGGGESPSASPSTTAADDAQLVLTPANYELIAGSPQRVIAGIQTGGDGRLLAFGEVGFSFAYLGTKEAPVQQPTTAFEATASYLPIPGQTLTLVAEDTPRLGNPSQGIGVYGASDVVFDRVGFWRVTATVDLAGEAQSAQGVVAVKADGAVPAVGDDALATKNPVSGADGVDPASIDSRAKGSGTVPDGILHRTSIADALAAGRPLMIVISTPVYCQSRFCGPITDSVEALARAHEEGPMAFVHLEVWDDFEAKKVSPFASEWISTPDGAAEPWVFVVDATGKITHRFDNVATDAELSAAVAAVLG